MKKKDLSRLKTKQGAGARAEKNVPALQPWHYDT